MYQSGVVERSINMGDSSSDVVSPRLPPILEFTANKFYVKTFLSHHKWLRQKSQTCNYFRFYLVSNQLQLHHRYYILDVLWWRLPNLIQPIYYSRNLRLSAEYLSFIFRPAIISCVQFDIMMTYSIFATKEDIQQLFLQEVVWIY